MGFYSNRNLARTKPNLISPWAINSPEEIFFFFFFFSFFFLLILELDLQKRDDAEAVTTDDRMINLWVCPPI